MPASPAGVVPNGAVGVGSTQVQLGGGGVVVHSPVTSRNVGATLSNLFSATNANSSSSVNNTVLGDVGASNSNRNNSNKGSAMSSTSDKNNNNNTSNTAGGSVKKASPPASSSSVSSSGGGGGAVMTVRSKADRFHAFMDRQCKWIVSSIVFCVCIVHTYVDARTVVVPYFVLAALAAAMGGKGLKRVLKQSRPPGAAKQDHGMPSSHAVSLSFLSTAVCVSCFVELYYNNNNNTNINNINNNNSSSPGHLAGYLFRMEGGNSTILVLEALTAVASAVYFSLLRIRFGHHTLAQVLVGFTFGSFCCVAAALANYCGWDSAAAAHSGTNAAVSSGAAAVIGGRVDDERFLSPIGRAYLNALFVVGACGFGFRYCRRWLREKGTNLARRPILSEQFSPTTNSASLFGALQQQQHPHQQQKRGGGGEGGGSSAVGLVAATTAVAGSTEMREQ